MPLNRSIRPNLVLAGKTKLKVLLFFGGYLFVFVKYLCNRSLKIKTKNFKNYSSVLAEVGKAQLEAQSATSAIAEVALRFNFLF